MTPSKSFAKAVSINNLNYLLLKRKNGDSIPAMHPRDQFTIFALIDRFLGGDGLLAEKHQFWDEISPIVAVTDDQKFEEMLASVHPMPEDRREKWTIIVFSETFFSDEPCDDAEVEQFMRLCRLLTEKYQKLIISVNFLHKYEGKSRSRKTPKGSDYIVSPQKRELLQNKSSNLRFSNSSLILWNRVPISCYRKATYRTEADDLVSEGYGYDFGDWKSHPTLELQAASDEHREIAQLFNTGKQQIIAARTCYDMNRTPKLSKRIKLLILTADDPPGVESWKNKVKNAVTCICDAKNTELLVISGIRYFATRVEIPSYFFNELFCILTVNYRKIHNEIVDVSCCGYCC
ncbi:MAG: hypothetical protein LBG04_00015 [Holosporaceae bacterium]|nr:hypothetical protein [Holosporaceae bacterium]